MHLPDVDQRNSRRRPPLRALAALPLSLCLSLCLLVFPLSPLLSPPLSGLTSAWAANAVQDEAEGNPELKRGREYRQGPLTSREFLGKPGEDSQLDAYTFTEMRFTFKYRYSPVRSGLLFRATNIEVFATFDPDKSWLRGEVGRRLLDHEQGHFDLTQIHAIRTNREIAKQLKQFVVVSSNRADGVKRLKKKLTDSLADAFAKCSAEQEDYDHQTKNGRQADAQRLHRRKQREILAQLKREKKGAPRRAGN